MKLTPAEWDRAKQQIGDAKRRQMEQTERMTRTHDRPMDNRRDTA